MNAANERVAVKTLNDHITCVLCGGYFVDATAIVDCQHTFCKTCIVQYLSASHFCPVCDVRLAEASPLLNLRKDQLLQDLVYKLVPGLLSGEMKRRKEFAVTNTSHGDSGFVDESQSGGDRFDDRRFYTEDEEMSILLEYSPDGKPPRRRRKCRRKSDTCGHNVRYRRYLQCPAPFTINHVTKFIRLKFGILPKYKIAVFHTDEPLQEHYSLMDVAYIYSWTRMRPLHLYFSVYESRDAQVAPSGSVKNSGNDSGISSSVSLVPVANRYRKFRRDENNVYTIIDIKPPVNYISSMTVSAATTRYQFSVQTEAVGRNQQEIDARLTCHQIPYRERHDFRRHTRSPVGYMRRVPAVRHKSPPNTKRIKQEVQIDQEFIGQQLIPSDVSRSDYVERSRDCRRQRASFQDQMSPSPPITGAQSTSTSMMTSLRFTPLTDASTESRRLLVGQKPAIGSGNLSELSANFSLPVTIPRDFIRELVVARELDKLTQYRLTIQTGDQCSS